MNFTLKDCQESLDCAKGVKSTLVEYESCVGNLDELPETHSRFI